jgi:hypothetical protein
MRYNIYNEVHRPLKLAMLQTSVEINSATTESADDQMNKIGEVIGFFKELLQYEHTYLLPLVFEFEPSIWNMYTTEHQAAMNICRKLEHSITKVCSLEDDVQKEQALRDLLHAYEAFLSFNLHHMNEEEEVLNEILWRYYSDEVLVEIERGMHHFSLISQHSIAA